MLGWPKTMRHCQPAATGVGKSNLVREKSWCHGDLQPYLILNGGGNRFPTLFTGYRSYNGRQLDGECFDPACTNFVPPIH